MRKFELASKFKSSWSLIQILDELKKEGSQKNIEGMKKFGISTESALGITIPKLRYLSYRIGKNHLLALEIWKSGGHEARILASMIDRPLEVTDKQMEDWVKDFNSWDLCDQVCGNLFDKTELSWKKAKEWSEREEEYVKRAGFVLMASLAVHNRLASNQQFEEFFPIIEREAGDDRNFVKKAVNWALRQIGKRNLELHGKAIEVAERIQLQESKSAKWIGHDALRELKMESTLKRFSPKKETVAKPLPSAAVSIKHPMHSERRSEKDGFHRKKRGKKIEKYRQRKFIVKKN